MNTNPLFFDYNSTTPVDPAVFQAMAPYFTEQFGNPSSQHTYGWTASKAVNDSRKQLALVLNCNPKEVIFTSGATESIHIAIMGIALNSPLHESHFITSTVEHSAVFMTFKNLEKLGAQVTYLPVSKSGDVTNEALNAAIKPNTKLISLIHANNEIGTVTNAHDIAVFCASKNIPLHLDGAQSFTKVEIDLKKTPISLLSISAHKIYGPKGVGALFVRDGLKLSTVIAGGSQEGGIRPGTHNVPGIVGLGTAAQIAWSNRVEESLRLKKFQTKILSALKNYESVTVNGCLENRLCNNLSITFKSSDPDLILQKISKVAFSQSSACTSSQQGSRVLTAIGLTGPDAERTVRIGLGRFTTEKEVDFLIDVLLAIAK